MNRFLLASASLLALAAIAPAALAQQATPMAAETSNVLLQPWTGPYDGVPPWDKVRPELFKPAFMAAIDMQRAEIAAIAANPDKPTFANTIEALERAGKPLDRVGTLFGVMTGNMNAPVYQALDKDMSPILSAASDEITFNKGLFARIAAVYETRESSGLSTEQQRLTKRAYDGYVRYGAKLNDAQKTELSGYNQQLATLFSDFGSKLLADEVKRRVAELPPLDRARDVSAAANEQPAAKPGGLVELRYFFVENFLG